MTQETFSRIEEISEHGIEYLNHTLKVYAGTLPEDLRDALINDLIILVKSERMKAAVITADHWSKIGGNEI